MLSDMLKRCHGQYTTETIQRCSQMSGAFKKELSRLLRTSMTGDAHDKHHEYHRRTPKYVEDLKVMMEEYRDDELFKYVKGRKHKGFVDFRRSSSVKNPYKLGVQLKDLSWQLDRWRRLRQTEHKSCY